jgi:hypothetical protein
MSYQPIENYGIIGNMRTVALVGPSSSMPQLCIHTSRTHGDLMRRTA